MTHLITTADARPPEASRVRLYNADCFDMLRTLDAGSVDCVLTDPPFAEKTHEGARSQVATGRAGRLGFADGEGVKKTVDFASWGNQQFLIFVAELVRVCTGWIVMTCDWRHAAVAEETGLPLVRLGVWIKPDAAPQFTGDRPGTGWEAVAIFHREGKKQWNGGGSHAVWSCERDRSKVHPSVKPLPLIERWVRLFSGPGHTILDPCMGSGTVGVAGLRTGRGFVGCEIDEAKFLTAQKRIAAEQDRYPLFEPPVRRRDEPLPLFAGLDLGPN